MIFTPLVSPAVTPLDNQFQYPEYAAPPEAFSPLTSPALRAQNQNQVAQNSAYGAVRGSDTSDTTSPIDPNLDNFTPQPTAAPAPLRKSRRKTSSSSTKNPARAVRQSPAMKPQKKKQPSSTVIPAKEVAGIIEEARKSKQSQKGEGRLPLPYSQDSSGPDSVSPEPLSDTLMPPPATPRSNSAGKSPYLDAKQGQHIEVPTQDANGEPATPASLMKIRKQVKKANGTGRPSSSLKEQTAAAEADMEQIMEDIILPEPASTTKKPNLRPINTTEANMENSTPTIAARKTPKYGPASAPITATTSTFPSPQPGSATSPPAVSKRGDTKLKSRDPKKRNSQSSVQVSPALRPKISPSIKPLLPEGGQYPSPYVARSTRANEFHSDCQCRNICPSACFQIQLPKHPRRYSPPRCLLPRNAFHKSHLQTHITQDRRARPSKPYQYGVARNRESFTSVNASDKRPGSAGDPKHDDERHSGTTEQQ